MSARRCIRAAPCRAGPCSPSAAICRTSAADPGYFTGLHQRLAQPGPRGGGYEVDDTPALFGWLVEVLSLQGHLGCRRLHLHGRARPGAVGRTWLEDCRNQPSCPKLTSHWHFHRCDFIRSRGTCAEPAHYPACPLPCSAPAQRRPEPDGLWPVPVHSGRVRRRSGRLDRPAACRPCPTQARPTTRSG